MWPEASRLEPELLVLVAGLLGGVAAGFLSGLMGIGGGLVLVPLFHYGLGLGWIAATTASLASMVLQVPVGVWRHHRRGAVDWPLGVLLAIGGAVGVGIGVASLPHLPVAWLKALFGIVLLWASWRLVTRPGRPRPRAPRSAGVAIGVAGGLLSRWLGIGGGLVTGPALMLIGTSPHTAVGSSLVAVWTNAVLASALALAAVGVPVSPATLLLGLFAGVGAVAGAPLGVHAAHALPERTLRRTVAAVVAVAAFWLLLRLALGLEAA